jgi:PAS domain-containing protein
VVEFSRRSRPPHPMILRVKSLIPPALVLVTLFLITLGLRYMSVRLIAEDVKKASHAECERVAELVYSQLELRMRALGQVSNHLIHSPHISEVAFRGYTSQTMAETPGFAAIALADPQLRAQLVESDDILWRTEFDRMLLSPTIAQAFEAARERAVASGKFVITDPLSFSGRPGFAALEPVYRNGELLGFIVGVFLYDRLERTLIPELSSDFNVSILQWNSQLNIPAYMRVVPDPFSGMKKILDEPAETSRHLGSQRFVVRVEPAGWESAYRGTMPALFSSGSILTIGTILAVLLSVLLYRQQMVATRSRTEAQASQTKLVLTRERLERIKEELDLILNNVDESIILYDHELGPLQANTSFRESFCPTPDMDLLDESAEAHHKRMASLFQNEAQYWSLLNNLKENPERPFTDEIDLREPGDNGSPTAITGAATISAGAPPSAAPTAPAAAISSSTGTSVPPAPSNASRRTSSPASPTTCARRWPRSRASPKPCSATRICPRKRARSSPPSSSTRPRAFRT